MPAEHWMSNPLKLVDSLFAECFNSNSCLKGDWGVKEFFSQCFNDMEIYHQIPSLNDVDIKTIPKGHLIRFRCMIQDMNDFEYYFNTFQLNVQGGTVQQTARYRDLLTASGQEISCEEISTQENNYTLLERKVFKCIEIPVENEWVQSFYSATATSSLVGVKRKFQECMEEEESAMVLDSLQTLNHPSHEHKTSLPRKTCFGDVFLKIYNDEKCTCPQHSQVTTNSAASSSSPC
eukprot:Sdes_comp8773_c0_seq1m147